MPQMVDRKYEYQGLLAETWDFVRGDTSDFPDTSFYQSLIEDSGQPALIVGCGTGRLPLEYSEKGLDVDGLDISPDVIKIFRQKAEERSLSLNIFGQAMEHMKLPRTYNSIVVPSSSFQLVTDLKMANSALSAFHDHLMPGGLLVISIWHIKEEEGGNKWGKWWQVVDKKGFQDGKTLKRWERSKYDTETQLRHTQNRYELWQGDTLLQKEEYSQQPELRSYSIGELSKMLVESNFVNVRSNSGFSNKPATSNDAIYCILANRAM